VQHADAAQAEADARTQLAAVHRILSKPEFSVIDAFTEKKGAKPFDPAWYEVLGVSSIRQMAKTLGKLREFQIYIEFFNGIGRKATVG
jgi:hypothetical protein